MKPHRNRLLRHFLLEFGVMIAKVSFRASSTPAGLRWSRIVKKVTKGDRKAGKLDHLWTSSSRNPFSGRPESPKVTKR